jgi:hypothetical protein
MTARLTMGLCDICGREAYIGRQGDAVCTQVCADARSHRRAREAETLSGLRAVLAEARHLDPGARLRVDEHGFYVAARVGGRRLRLETHEDVAWVTIDLQWAAA